MPQVTGWLPAGQVAASAFTNPQNALTSDSNRATVTWSTGERQIVAYNFTGLAAAIPTGAIIRGIEVRVEGSRTGAALAYEYHELVNANTFRPKSQTTKTLGLTGTETRVIMGGGTDRWGDVDTNGTGGFDRLWAKSDFTNLFAVELNFAASSSSTVSINAIWIQVTFDAVQTKLFAFGWSQEEVQSQVPLLRLRRVIPATVTQTEIINPIPFLRTKQVAVTPIGQTQTITITQQKWLKGVGFSVPQNQTINFFLGKVAPFGFSVPQTQTINFPGFYVPKLFGLDINQTQTVTFGTPALVRGFVLPVPETSEIKLHLLKQMYFKLDVPQEQTYSFFLGGFTYFGFDVNQAGAYSTALDRFQRIYVGVGQTQTIANIPVIRARLNIFKIDQVEGYTQLLKRSRGNSFSIPQTEVISPVLTRFRSNSTSIAQTEVINVIPLLRTRRNSFGFDQTETFTPILKRSRGTGFSVGQTEDFSSALNRFRTASIYIIEQKDNPLFWLDRTRVARFSNDQVETFNAVPLRRTRGVVYGFNQTENFSGRVNRFRTTNTSIAQTETFAGALNRVRRSSFGFNQTETFTPRLTRTRGQVFGFNQAENFSFSPITRERGQTFSVDQVSEYFSAIGIIYDLGFVVDQAQTFSFPLDTIFTGPDPELYANNFIIDQGQTVDLQFDIAHNGVPHDLNEWSVRSMIRRSWDGDVLVDCTLDNGRMYWVDRFEGKFGLLLNEFDTSYSGNPKIKFAAGEDSIECVYDIEMVSPQNTVWKVSRGTLTILREVTR